MSSSRMIELVNALHHQLANDNLEYLFAGKQVIIVGEFLQLRLVPDFFDDGKFMFASLVFRHAIAHRFQLTTVMRQQNDERLLRALGELRLGVCSEESAQFLVSLARPLPNTCNNTVHIFFKKIPVMIYNRSQLDLLDTPEIKIDATCEGDTIGMKCPCFDTLHLKHDCRVMLVWNLNERLHNGSIGIFKRMVNEKSMEVHFEGTGRVILERQTWINKDRDGKTKGSKRQFPVILAYGIKSQGLTLPSVVVHMSNEFVSGLTYVAVSRVKSATHLQVLGFSPEKLTRPSSDALSTCSTFIGEVFEDHTCCRKKLVENESLFEVSDNFSVGDMVDESNPLFPPSTVDRIVESFYETPNQVPAVELITVLEQLIRHEDELAQPPPGLDVNDILKSVLVNEPLSGCAKSNNLFVHELMSPENQENVATFANIIWYHIFLLMEKFLEKRNDELMVINISRKNFSSVTGKLHKLINSETFREYVNCLGGSPGGVSNRSDNYKTHKTVATKVCLKIYLMFLEHLGNLIQKELVNNQINFNVEDMSAPGRSKVRHVGGWALRKVLERSRKYINHNIHTSSSNTLQKVQQKQDICNLIEEFLILPFSKVEESTKYPETLEVTESLQYRCRGLVHISDAAYLFFMALEQHRISVLNDTRLNIHRDKMLEVALEEIKKDKLIATAWGNCFLPEILCESTTWQVLDEVLLRYMHIGAAQYLRDYRRTHNLKKAAEHRKALQQRQQKKKENAESVLFEEIQKDNSERKQFSHHRLSRFIEQFGLDPLVRVYYKNQLCCLCKAYAVRYSTRATKKVLGLQLKQFVRLNRHIPFPEHLQERQFFVSQLNIVGQGQGINMTITGNSVSSTSH